MLHAAIERVRYGGGNGPEAFPMNQNGTSDTFMGQKSIFAEAGFSYCCRVGLRRNCTGLAL